MNTLPKLVVSRTLAEPEWANTRVVSTDVRGEVSRFKETNDRSIAVFGSAALTGWLLREGLLDELRLMVMPVVLGAGRGLFQDASGRIGLRLIESTAFASGNVLDRYRPSEIGVNE